MIMTASSATRHTITVTIEVTDQNVDDILTTAIDSGISYWCREVKVVDGDYKGAQYASEVISRGGALKLYAYERPRTDSKQSVFKLTLEKVLRGIRLYATSRGGLPVDHEGQLDTGEIDAPRADSIVQFALFGQEVFG